jgi:hypothetical protein
MATPIKSRYLPIWNELKEKGKCRLAAPPALHPRIIKAVKKRRNQDIAFSFLIAEDHKKARLHFESKGSFLSITLHISIGLSEL